MFFMRLSKTKCEIKSSVENRNIFKCPNCSVQFMHPQTSEEELNQIYSNENYPTCSFDKGFENEIIKMKRKTFNNILNKVISYCKRRKYTRYRMLKRNFT